MQAWIERNRNKKKEGNSQLNQGIAVRGMGRTEELEVDRKDFIWNQT